MSASRIQPFLSKAVNLVTVESIARQNLFSNLSQTRKSTILTTVEAQTHHKYANELTKLASNSNIKVVPYFQPLVDHHFQLQKIQFQNKDDPRGISLLVGNNNEEMVRQLNESKIITMEELCQAFPEKIPLSFRNRDCQVHIKKLEKRIGAQLNRKKVLQFEHIIMISPDIKIWDEAIQVIMDFMPTPFYVPYLKKSQGKIEAYELNLDDFLSALAKIQKTMKVVVKNHADPSIIRYDQKMQLNWMISKLAPQASQMVIDRYFFSEQPKTMKECQKGVKIPVELKQFL